MSIPFSFTYKDVQHKASLELIESSSEKDISIGGRNYKILANEEDMPSLRSYIGSLKTSDFDDVSSFEASLIGIGPHEKTHVVFQKTIDISMGLDVEVKKIEISAVSTEASINIQETVGKACDLIEKYYIFPDQARVGIEKIKEKLSNGHYDAIKDVDTFAVAFTKDLKEIIKDKHFDIVILPPNENQTLPDVEEWISNLQEMNFGLGVEKNSDNIGVLKLYQFNGVDFSNRDYVPPKVAQKTREAFDKAIDTMRGSSAIIIDMRENGGGSPYAVQFLSSYFLPEQTELNTIRSRENEKESIQKFNTLSYNELPRDKRLLDVPLYILTSEGTFSAAEEFTYDMQVLGRGTVIGETTGGGANPCHLKPLNNNGLYIAIPDEEAINPHTKTNWEGHGVSPTHKVAAEDALTKANELIKNRSVKGQATFDFTHVEVEHAPRKTNEVEAIHAIRSKLGVLDRENKFSGTLIVTKIGNREPLIASAVGFANMELNQKNGLETCFNIASIGKMFTTVAVLQLVEQGKLSLNDPIGMYLPEITNDKMKQVTISQLLTHTGGAGEIDRRAPFREISHFRDYIEISKDNAPSFAPGTKCEYSNFGFILLGGIIEKLSHQDYYEYVQESIFDFAGMQGSSFPLKTELPADAAVGYIATDTEFFDNQDVLPLRGLPSGLGFSTGPDLVRFCNALLEPRGQKLLRDSSTLALAMQTLTVTNDKEHPTRHSMGFMTGDNWFGHSGHYDGANGEVRIYPQTGYIVVALANRDQEAASDLAQFIDDTLPL